MKSSRVSVLAYNIRSIHNVGSIFRTCEGFGVEHLYLSGYTPYPRVEKDLRLPYVAEKMSLQINKTALGAEKMVPFSHASSPFTVMDTHKKSGYTVLGLEQDKSAISLPDFDPPGSILLVIGEEVHGIASDIKKECDVLLEIPMNGAKESFNVSVAIGIALYGLCY